MIFLTVLVIGKFHNDIWNFRWICIDSCAEDISVVSVQAAHVQLVLAAVWTHVPGPEAGAAFGAAAIFPARRYRLQYHVAAEYEISVSVSLVLLVSVKLRRFYGCMLSSSAAPKGAKIDG